MACFTTAIACSGLESGLNRGAEWIGKGSFLAASYHAVGAVSEGHPFAIVVTSFWIYRSRPFLNLTTKVFGSMYLDSMIKSRNLSR